MFKQIQILHLHVTTFYLCRLLLTQNWDCAVKYGLVTSVHSFLKFGDGVDTLQFFVEYFLMTDPVMGSTRTTAFSHGFWVQKYGAK